MKALGKPVIVNEVAGRSTMAENGS